MKREALIIKVCGMREASNIRDIEALGIDWLGLIFWPKSSRYVSERPDYLPRNAKRVGVFVDEAPEKIVNISGENWIQEPPPAPEWRLIAGAAADLLERQCASLLLPQDLKTTMCSVWLLMLDMSGTSAAPQTQWEVYNSEFFQTGCQLLTLRARFDPRLAFAVEYWEQVRDRLACSRSGQAAGSADMAEFEALPEDQVSGESDGNSVTAAQPLSDGEYSNDESFF